MNGPIQLNGSAASGNPIPASRQGIKTHALVCPEPPVKAPKNPEKAYRLGSNGQRYSKKQVRREAKRAAAARKAGV